MTTVPSVREQEVVTVTLPPPDTRTTLAQRLSLRLALWLLLRSTRPRRATAPRRDRPRRTAASVPAPHLHRDAATALNAYAVFRQQR